MWETVGFGCMIVACIGPIVLAAGVGYVVLDYFEKWDAINRIFERPIASLSLNDVLIIFGSYSVLIGCGWVGKIIGIDAMHATQSWFLEKEKSPMPPTREDIQVYECPQCHKTGTYRPAGTDTSKQTVYECSKCGRKVGEKSLERDLRRRD